MAGSSGDISAASSFIGTALTGISGAIKSGAEWREYFALQAQQIAGLFAQQGAKQSGIQGEILSDYEKQLQSDSRAQLLKAAFVSFMLIALAIALVYFLRKAHTTK